MLVAADAGVPHDPDHNNEQCRRHPLCPDCGSRDTWWAETDDGGEVFRCDVCSSCVPAVEVECLIVPAGPPIEGFDDEPWDAVERAVIERVLAELTGWRAQGAESCTITIEVTL